VLLCGRSDINEPPTAVGGIVTGDCGDCNA
jgi:hypothetical protein